MRLILVRHGKTATDNPEKCHGFTDIDLSDEGYRQADQLAERFKGQKIDAIYASTLRRGIETAERIASIQGIKINSAPELNEVNFGQIEGITFEEACGLFPEVTDLWQCGSTKVCFPLGERFLDFVERVNSFIKILKTHKDNETIMLVGHGGPYKVLVCTLLGLPVDHYWQFKFDMASVSIIDIYSTGAILGKLSDTSHLIKETK
ncbi:histidine phosphatase family protein [Dehalogenimonas etheniformans]|uniref:Histidine phosphatase family protein n=1 Tax=Dehalogenimonas etheniformans TaxID=1536648 RepID=A0A2P5P9E4_9CHLR|nr:histidine phosphatase family protein [Dehalogenimonas etheniformans]PPD58921.1 histidine phosphatase family protein [Dehalogenimonas etheniformans]QNT76313.1 histidine phosphatase family protein [Dehalogenimonas etheniformans]